MATEAPRPEPLPRPFADGMAAGRRIVRVDSQMASVHLVMAYGALIPAGTIRQWANRGHITRAARGEFRYDLEEIVGYAYARGLLDG